CGGENPAEAMRCVHCSDVLDPTFETPAAPAPPMDRRIVAIVGAVAIALVVILHVVGLGFSMRLLPATAPSAELQSRMTALVDDNVLEPSEARTLTAQLAIEWATRAELKRGSLSEAQANALRERLPPEDQSTVIGVQGIFGLLPIFIAFLLAGVVGTAVARGRRVREVALGLLAASGLQFVLWMWCVEFDLAALVGGRLLMAGPGPAFTGGPVLLLAVSIIGSLAAASGLGYAVGVGLDQAQGNSDCPHCGHVFPRSKGQLQCPSCTRPLDATPPASMSGPGGMTRALTGASELLCIQCAKTYAADTCPTHADEPLLDPRRDDVRFQLLDLDTQAGTTRFTRWTEGLGAAGHGDTQTTNGGVCMECAKAYETPACPLHADEPLLDPSREEVRLEMEETDDRRRRQVGSWLMFGAFGLAAAANVGLANLIDLDSSLLLSSFAGSLVGLIAIARVLTPALSPPRYGRWTGSEAISGDALSHSARQELLEPLKRKLRGALAQGKRLAVVSLVGAILGAGVAFGLQWPLVLGSLLGAIAAALGFIAIADFSTAVREGASEASKAWRDPYA
ncbi:MAG: hypothetical protein KUG77_25105, partial [Nannocystaceae bacterium]|nr:hypothetical protein [Nannocystaceae bacterium]